MTSEIETSGKLRFDDIYIYIYIYIYVIIERSHIGSGNGLLPVQHQAITWTNGDLLSMELFRTNHIET